MYQFRQTKTAASKTYEEGAFQRVSVNLPGRLMLDSREEFDCTAVDMSPGDVVLSCPVRPRNGERIIAYLDHVGRVEGAVSRLQDQSFVLQINATDRKREKLAAQLTWIANKHELGLPEDRRHDRLAPRRTLTQLTLESGEKYAARLLDLSLSGAAVDTEMRVPIGTPILVGTMKGRVVRVFQEGMAIEFTGIQSRESLREFL
ncbi:PilZ domain-containing protein [Rhizobium sp. CC-YZS058]|uniref:PilZ domain-containing protein n=1 Tax=Rhizobium sp. CC-YZS058 TaxID=3042153 RepID=UPI002B061699|nr:PilZ domain-containing protein [Rhizobium sp. CC-YZS058]MEA3535091.1 PilZ domain-containing protein [Rhizobium sp. CC-YZS058]